jgi:hypothetical protein
MASKKKKPQKPVGDITIKYVTYKRQTKDSLGRKITKNVEYLQFRDSRGKVVAKLAYQKKTKAKQVYLDEVLKEAKKGETKLSDLADFFVMGEKFSILEKHFEVSEKLKKIPYTYFNGKRISKDKLQQKINDIFDTLEPAPYLLQVNVEVQLNKAYINIDDDLREAVSRAFDNNIYSVYDDNGNIALISSGGKTKRDGAKK